MNQLKALSTGERGGVATLVALFFGLAVALGAASLSMDVGKLMWERRELQNGADSAALSLAQSCAKDNCIAGADGLTDLADSNAADSMHTIERQCRSAAVLGSLPLCENLSNMSDLQQCPPLPPAFDLSKATLKYVEVRTESLSAEGGFVTNLLARAAGGVEQTTLRSCARVAWGAAKSASTLPLTIATCEYKEAVAKGPGVETAIPLKYAKDAEACDPLTAPSGGDFAGGFGFLTQSGCLAKVDANSWVDANTGVGKANECMPSIKPGDVIYIPVFDCISETKTLCVTGKPSGTHTNYHIDGYAAFKITAFDIAGNKAGTPGIAANNECKKESKDNKCIFGIFLDKYVASMGEIDPGGVSEYGTSVIQPVG